MNAIEWAAAGVALGLATSGVALAVAGRALASWRDRGLHGALAAVLCGACAAALWAGLALYASALNIAVSLLAVPR